MKLELVEREISEKRWESQNVMVGYFAGKAASYSYAEDESASGQTADIRRRKAGRAVSLAFTTTLPWTA